MSGKKFPGTTCTASEFNLKILQKKSKSDISKDDLNTAFITNKKATTPSPGKFKASSMAYFTPRIEKRILQVSNSNVDNAMPNIANACFTPRNYKKNNIGLDIRTPTMINTYNSPKIRTMKQNNYYTNTDIQIVTPDKANLNSTHHESVSNLNVAVRVRPLIARECTRAAVSHVIKVVDNVLTVKASNTNYTFTYDNVFNSCDPENDDYATQKIVFEGTALPLIDCAFQGYNACLFAYGQTGSGKSYSMMGIDALHDSISIGDIPHSETGIIPRFCKELFNHINSVKEQYQIEVEVSYFEIYNEKIHDLLSVTQQQEFDLINMNINTITPCSSTNVNYMQRPALKVREHPIYGPYVVDLNIHPVDSYESVRNWLAVGNSQRATAETYMNDKSSRAHSIFNIVLSITSLSSECLGDKSNQTRRSKISLVDLAGSERISNTDKNGDRIREGVCINKSLLTLGKVIAALSTGRKNLNSSVFVPYRESVLTWLLRENLGGNSKTVMLATISPASTHLEETMTTLRYACQARTIVNRIKINESMHDKIIRELRAEVDRLKSLRNEFEREKRLSIQTPTKAPIEKDNEVEMLRQQLAERERELTHAEKSWMQRLEDAEILCKSEMRVLKRKGLALEVSTLQTQACLVNLTIDPILSGTLFYMLPEGTVMIGKMSVNSQCIQPPDIVLDGITVANYHCKIENENCKLYIIPENEGSKTFLNGELVQNRMEMFHGDRLVIGKSHYFRISNPFCNHWKKDPQKQGFDYISAHGEILQKQEKKLREKLEEEKCQALSQIELERLNNEKKFIDKVQQLELEQLKFKCNHEILETEREALKNQVASVNKEMFSGTSEITTYKSTLIEDINSIMHNPSAETIQKTELTIRKANDQCRYLGLEYEFYQIQNNDEFEIIRSLIIILDKKKRRKTQWPIARLRVWLDIIKDMNINEITDETIFGCFEINWIHMKEDFDVYTASELNIESNSHKHKIKDTNSWKSTTYVIKLNKFKESATTHIIDMQKSSILLKNLCQDHKSHEVSNSMESIINKIDRLDKTLHEILLYINHNFPQKSLIQ